MPTEGEQYQKKKNAVRNEEHPGQKSGAQNRSNCANEEWDYGHVKPKSVRPVVRIPQLADDLRDHEREIEAT